MCLAGVKIAYYPFSYNLKRKFRTFFGLLFVLLCIYKQGGAQNLNYKVGTLANQSNITHNTVSSIYIDSIGVMWFGKMDGLHKYNGYEVEVTELTFNGVTGISNPWVTDIKGVDNHLLIGTRNGLNILNKKNQTYSYVFPSDYSFSYSNHITCIGVNKNNEILVGTGNKFLTIIAEKANAFSVDEIHFEGFRWKESDIQALQIIDVPNGNLIRTSKGIFFLETASRIARKVLLKFDSIEESKKIRTIYLTKSNQLLIGTDNDEYYTSFNETQLAYKKEYDVNPLSDMYPNWPTIKKTNVFLEDSNGLLWVGTEGEGLFVYDKNTFESKTYNREMYFADGLDNDFVKTLYEDKSGMILAGTDSGITTFNPLFNRFQLINRIKNDYREGKILNVHSILQDNYKNLWLGTRGEGIFIIGHGRKSQANIKRAGKSSLDLITAIVQDKKQHIWIGTEKGIYVIEEVSDDINKLIQGFKNKTPNILPDDFIHGILEDEDGNKWISSYSGLYIYTSKNVLRKIGGGFQAITNSNNQNVLKDEDGNKWLTSYSGLYVNTSKNGLSKTDDGFEAIIKTNNYDIHTLLLDSDKRIWYGTSNGMLGYIAPEDYLNKDMSLPSNFNSIEFNLINVIPEYRKFYDNYSIFSITETRDKNIFVGTNLGLCKVDKERNELSPFSNVPPNFNSRNIQSSYIYSLLYDNANNKLWAGTNNGLFSYNFKTKEENNYTVKDGLQSLEFNGGAAYKSKDGNLFFGGSKGINIYNTSHQLGKSDFRPNLVLTKLFVNGKPLSSYGDSEILTSNISYTKEITLDAKKNTIGLEFASLHLPYSYNNFYKCKLLGVDDDWIDLKHKRSINYANLPKGQYTFKLMGTNNDEVWNTPELNFGIEILPAWYETWWMKTVWFLSGLLILSTFIWMLLKNKDNINALKIKDIEQQTLHEIYESKLVFFTNLSHEFRTPLSLIFDPIHSLIKQKSVYNANKELFDIIKNNVDRLRRLIDQILDFRKFEYGKFSLNIIENDIVATLLTISKSFTYHSEIKNIDFKIQLPEKSIKMFYDKDSIEKIVYNILSNAFKASANGGVVKISVKEMGPKDETPNYKKYKFICGEKKYTNFNDHVSIKVDDDGVGITEENLERIFTRFYQTNSVDSGTGIGLYMVKQFTEMHSGSILIKSKRNKGSSLIIILPKNNELYKASEEPTFIKPYVEEDLQAPKVAVKKLTAKETKTHTVVIVEDNDELRTYLELLLNNYYNVFTANNGEAGFELIQEKVPDLVISDIVMPEISGLQLCARVKGNFETSHIPIILLTARAFDNQVVEGINAGADDYIVKPFNKEILVSKINNLIQNREKLRLMFQSAKLLEPSKVTVTSIDEKFLYKLKETVENNIQDQNLTLQSLAEEVNVSRGQLFRKIKALTGLTPNNFIKSIRLKHAVQLLDNKNFRVSEVAFLSGFKEASYFSRCFKEEYGCSPKEYKTKG
ncbi:hybrid sensor histidine kinase/response regulator transcription factor [Flavivirga eckloniae]|uniref:histidine kinase n=1 Tax=Flavivirga eckloniae TaxID=1803846 RepID=A0A2K9PNQ0_9FLAO|nr:hybrid sensor histidine kinase/response regulator transcription factor [Flavivirga eckloniae]AUP78693.1 hypothetical protein C1H87_08230 [Flavivirga eckloniae]